jgi:hypothetical protein
MDDLADRIKLLAIFGVTCGLIGFVLGFGLGVLVEAAF